MRLESKVALVTGASRGIGRAVAVRLGRDGAAVVVNYAGSHGAAREAVAAVEQAGGRAVAVQADVSQVSDVERLFDATFERFGRLDILVNNAGMNHGASVLAMERTDWDAVVETNLTGMFLCAKHAAAAMVARGAGGKIINISSIYSLFGTPSFAAYGASKAGVLGLTRALAIELAVHGIQVNAILPGWCETDMTHGMPASELGEQIRRRTPAGRWGQPDDMVGAAVFLASAASDFVTGVHLPVDGGYAVSERFVHP